MNKPPQNRMLDDEGSHVVLQNKMEAIRGALEASDKATLALFLQNLHGADIADLLEQITSKERSIFLELVPEYLDGDVLTELDEGLREELIEELAPNTLAEAVRDLETDDVVDIVEDLAGVQKEIILEALTETDRVVVEQSLSYPEDSAGRLMQRETVTAPRDWAVGSAIDFLRGHETLPEHFYHVILVDPMHHPIGFVTLSKILSAKRIVALKDLCEDTFHTISVSEHESDVAYTFNQYNLISAPVIDDTGRLVGVITIDDAMDVLHSDADEDIKRLAGISDESLTDSTLGIAQRRFPWLFVNLLTAVLASSVIAQFEATLSKLVALAILMPIVASMGGNAGTQSLTVAVRALATRDLTITNVWRVLRREVVAGLINGLSFAVIIGIISYIWFSSPLLGVVIGIAMVINLIIAAFVGIIIPIALDKGHIDPALASGTFVTTVTDIVGFFVFLGLAHLVLF